MDGQTSEQSPTLTLKDRQSRRLINRQTVLKSFSDAMLPGPASVDAYDSGKRTRWFLRQCYKDFFSLSKTSELNELPLVFSGLFVDKVKADQAKPSPRFNSKCWHTFVLGQWKGINRKQITRCQHLSQLKASEFFSLQNIFTCYETQQLILWTGTAIWWVTEPHCIEPSPSVSVP
jgi:hypothetical protein